MPELSRSHAEQPPEAAARLLANTQSGRLSVQQLKDLGFSKDEIHTRVKSGLWVREHRGVILLGHETGDYRGRCWAAQLAYGPDAVISHRAAGALWGIVKWDGPVDVALPHRRSSRAGTQSHESRTLKDDQIRIHHGLCVTNPLRTLVDLADVLTAHDLERAISETHRLGYISRHDLRAPETPGRKG